MTVRETLRANLFEVQERIAKAAERSGRASNSITLVAATKYVSQDVIHELIDLGWHDLGESRPQQLWDRAAQFDKRVRWHFIGHLQRNKVARTLPLVHLLHSVDSLRLLTAIDAEAAAQQLTPEILLEVNISGDAAKDGFPPDEVEAALTAAAGLKHMQVCGLMGMAGLDVEADVTRQQFRTLADLRERLERSTTGRHVMRELSMGMSGDFEIAIEEGATIVRVGSALFEGLET